MPHTPYVDFAYYRDEFGGELIPEESWPACARVADAYLDAQTMHRVKILVNNGEHLPLEAAFALCAVAEAVYKDDLAEAQRPLRVHSAGTTDGHSETFVSAADARKTRANAMKDAMNLYLPRTDPLRYRGVI
jgi:hypothetical protein